MTYPTYVQKPVVQLRRKPTSDIRQAKTAVVHVDGNGDPQWASRLISLTYDQLRLALIGQQPVSPDIEVLGDLDDLNDHDDGWLICSPSMIHRALCDFYGDSRAAALIIAHTAYETGYRVLPCGPGHYRYHAPGNHKSITYDNWNGAVWAALEDHKQTLEINSM